VAEPETSSISTESNQEIRDFLPSQGAVGGYLSEPHAFAHLFYEVFGDVALARGRKLDKP
jgi:hypothetical protein